MYVFAVPAQVPILGVTVIVATIFDVVLFVVVNIGTGPLPDAANPMAVLLLLQA